MTSQQRAKEELRAVPTMGAFAAGAKWMNSMKRAPFQEELKKQADMKRIESTSDFKFRSVFDRHFKS